MVKVAPKPLVVIGALGFSQLFPALRHKRSHSPVDVAEDFVVGAGIEVAHEQNAFPFKPIKQLAQSPDGQAAVSFTFRVVSGSAGQVRYNNM